MKYINILRGRGSYSLDIAECNLPIIRDHEILIKVAAVGLNRADIYQAEGSYLPPEGASPVLGLEVSGEVAKTGDKVKTHSVGDKVCAILQGGGYATYIAVPEWRALPIPSNVKLIEAAAIPETFFTAYLNLFELARLKPGETVLIHGGSSGLGTSAIQLAKEFGADVIITSGSDEKCLFCTSLGADVAINYKTEDYVEAVKEITGGKGVNVIMDIVGGEYFQRNMKALSIRGRMLLLSFITGAKIEVNLAPILMKNLTIIGSTMRSRTEEEIYNLAQSIRSTVWPMFEDGRIKPVIDSIFDMKDAAKAHTRMQNFMNKGKILLRME